MWFPDALVPGRLLRRYKRFLADVALDTGEEVTAHTPNPGAMAGLTRPGSRVYLSRQDRPSRRLKYTWELVRVGRRWVGVNPTLANRLVEEAIAAGKIPELGGYGSLRREVPYGRRGSRVDLCLRGGARARPCYLEVKSVTLLEGDAALFPDAVSARARRHLLELTDVVRAGDRGVVFFLVQRGDAAWVGPAERVDPAYAEALRAAARAGVEPVAYRASVGRRRIVVADRLPVRLGGDGCN